MIQIDGINKPKRCMTFNDLDTIERCPLLNESDDCSLIVALHDGFYEDATISWDEQYANCPLKEVTPAERKKGKWMHDNPNTFRCSRCNKYLDISCGNMKMNFCPNCGADMRKREDNNV